MQGRDLASPLAGVANDAWTRFVHALEVQPVKAVSKSGGFGAYDMRPRRLVELGYATKLRYLNTDGDRCIYVCEFKKPMTEERFLADTMTQYRVFACSMKRYHEELISGAINRPADLSIAGALAILHRGGTGALSAWPSLFEHTRALYEAAKGEF